MSQDEEQTLSRYVANEMSRTDADQLDPFRAYSSLASYLAVVVQRLCHAVTGAGGRSNHQPTPVQNAIRRTSAHLSSRDTLVLKMWFESGMTTQKIARILGMAPSDVYAIIASETGGVQQSLAESHPAAPPGDD